jgi:hypothetical protein
VRAGMNRGRRLGLMLRWYRVCCHWQWFWLALRRPMRLRRDGRRHFMMAWRGFMMGRGVPGRQVCVMRPFAWPMLPIIRRARMIMMPDDDLARVPVAIVVEPKPHGPPHTERDVKSIRRRWSFDVNDLRTINGDVDHLPHSRNDYNCPSFGINDLLRSRVEVAESSRLCAQPLHCIHDIRWLIQKRPAQVSRPGQIVVHHSEHFRVVGDGSDAAIPWLGFDKARVASSSNVTVCPNDLLRHRCRRQDLRQERVGVQGDGCHHLVEFIG